MANPTDIVTLAQVHAHLRLPANYTTDDTALALFISAADDCIEAEIGDVLPKHYDEYFSGGNYYVYLRHCPVLSVEGVEEGWGWWNWELDYQQVNSQPAGAMFAYSLDSVESGAVSRRSAGNVMIPFVPGSKNIRVWYTAGMQSIPGSVQLAALELIAHWYQNSQMRSMANSSQYASFDSLNEDFTRATGVTSINAGLPWRVLELLKRHRRLPIIG